MRRTLGLFILLISALCATAHAADVRLAFELPAMDGIIEGIAYRPSNGDCFFGDVHNRCVWRRTREGRLTRFSSDAAKLFGVFNVTVDEKRGLLWAATSMVTETRGFTPADKGKAALVGLRLATGDIAEVDPLPSDGHDHVLGDLLLSSDGNVFLTDSISPEIWKRAAANTPLALVVESSRFRSLQGLSLRADGKTLIVTDYARGIFAVDATTGAMRDIPAPNAAEVRGLDGIVGAGDVLYAVQNGREPNSVVRITLAPGAAAVHGVETITSSAAGLADLTLITRGPSGWWVVSNSGWALADPKRSPDIAAHTVRVYEIVN